MNLIKKQFKQFTAVKLMLRVALLGWLAALPAKAQLQIPIPYAISVATNQQSTSAATSTNPVWTTGAAFTLPVRGMDLNLMFSTTVTNTGTSNNVFGFNEQIAGVWTTGYPLQITNSNNGTNQNAVLTNNGIVNWNYILRATNIPGVNAIRLDYFNTWQTNPVYINGIFVDYNH